MQQLVQECRETISCRHMNFFIRFITLDRANLVHLSSVEENGGVFLGGCFSLG